MPIGELTFELFKDYLQVSGKKTKVKLNVLGYDVSEFPVYKYEHAPTLKINSKRLKEILEKVVIASGTNIGFNIDGLLFKSEDDRLCVVGTDSLRMAIYDEEVKSQDYLVIPRAFIKKILQVVKDDEDVELGFHENFLSFGCSSPISLFSQRLENKFPDFKKFIPEESKISLDFGRSELLATLKRVRLMGEFDDENPVVLEIKKNLLTLRRRNPIIGEIEEEVEFETQSIYEPFRIGIDISKLIDLLEVLVDETLVLEISDNKRSIIFRKDNYLYFTLTVEI